MKKLHYMVLTVFFGKLRWEKHTCSSNRNPTKTIAPVMIFEPTNAEGYNLPIKLSNVTLVCKQASDYTLEFDFQPASQTIDRVEDLNSD